MRRVDTFHFSVDVDAVEEALLGFLTALQTSDAVFRARGHAWDLVLGATVALRDIKEYGRINGKKERTDPGHATANEHSSSFSG